MKRISLRVTLVAVFSAVGLLISTTSASAVVTRLTQGSWFVGKGDIQSAFGWDAKTTDANMNNLEFTYEKVKTYYFDCVDAMGAKETHRDQDMETFSMTKNATYSTRISKGTTTTSVTGFNVSQRETIELVTAKLTCSDGSLLVDNSTKVSTLVEYLYVTSTVATTTRKTSSSSTAKKLLWSETTNPFNP